MHAVQVLLSEHEPQFLIISWQEVHLPESKAEPAMQPEHVVFEGHEKQF
jgi:hypothetical protein